MPETNTLDYLLQKARERMTATGDLSGAAPPDPTFEAAKNRRMSIPQREEAYRAAGEADNVPFDATAGPSFLQRAAASYRREPEQVLKYWQDLYGKQNVRLHPKTGDLIVRTLGEDGKPKDIPVDERKITMGDISDLAGIAPELAGTVVGLVLGKKLPGGTFKDLLTGAIGGETAGVLKDVAARKADDLPDDIGGVLFDRYIVGVPSGVALGGAMVGGGKLLGKVITPFGDRVPPIVVDAEASRQYIKATMGVDVPLSAGQRTGNRLLLDSETQLSRLPGASGPFRDLREQQQSAFQQIMNVIQGLPKNAGTPERAAIMTAEDLSQRVSRVLQGKLNPVEMRVQGARTKLVESAHQEIDKLIDSSTHPARQLYLSKVGESVRAKANAKLQDWNHEVGLAYEAAFRLPGGETRILDVSPLARDAGRYIKNKLPQKDVIHTLPTGPVTRSEVLKEFVPEGVLTKLRGLESLGTTKVSLRDMIAIRNEIDNAIAEGEAIPGVRTHHLNEMRKMVTRGIEHSTGSLPGGALKNAWKAANDKYAQGVGQFQTRLVSRLLKDPNAPGYIGDQELVKNIIAGVDKLDEIKTFLGPASPEFGMIKRAIADRQYENALYPGQRVLDAKSYMKALEDLRANNREVFDEVYGRNGDRLIGQASRMVIGQHDKLDVALLESGLRNPRGDFHIRDLIDSERAKDIAYQNDILKSIGSTTAPGKGIDPAEFVGRFINSATPTQIRTVMSKLPPELQWQIRAKTVEKLFYDASRAATPQDKVAFALDPNRVIASHALENLMKQPEKQAVLKEIIGDDSIANLKHLANLLRVVEPSSSGAAAAGGISGGMQRLQLWHGDVGTFAHKTTAQMLGAMMITMPGVRYYFGNRALTQQMKHAFTTGLIASEPVAEQLLRDFGESGAVYVAETVKQANDAMLYQDNQQRQQGQVTPQQALDYLRTMTNRPTATPRP